MTFGQRLKELRKQSNISQAELAKAINRSRPTIAGYEIGDRLPDIETLKKISEYFNVSIDDLLCKTNTHNLEPNYSKQLDGRLRRLLNNPEMLVAFKGLEDMTDEEKEGLITYLETMKARRNRGKSK